jgi:hypothetical protein
MTTWFFFREVGTFDYLLRPRKNRRVRDPNAPLRHHRHEISIAQPVGDVPAAKLNDVGVKGAAAVHGVTSDRLVIRSPSEGAEFYVKTRKCTGTSRGRRAIASAGSRSRYFLCVLQYG